MRKTNRIVILATVSIAAMSLQAAQTSTCVTEGSNGRVVWTAPAGEPVRAVRAYFRSDAATAEHYVELRRNGNAFTGVLPKVSGNTAAITYRIASASADGRFTTREEGRIAVNPGCALAKLDASEMNSAKTLIVGATSDGPSVPAGFRCDGIIGRVNKSGVLSAYAACNEIAAASKSPEVVVADATASATAPADATAKTAKRAPRVVVGDGTFVNNGVPLDRKPPEPIISKNPRGRAN